MINCLRHRNLLCASSLFEYARVYNTLSIYIQFRPFNYTQFNLSFKNAEWKRLRCFTVYTSNTAHFALNKSNAFLTAAGAVERTPSNWITFLYLYKLSTNKISYQCRGLSWLTKRPQVMDTRTHRHRQCNLLTMLLYIT